GDHCSPMTGPRHRTHRSIAPHNGACGLDRGPPPVAVTSLTEGREPDAQVAHGEAVQVPGAATRDLLGLGAEKPGELPLEAQPRVLLDDALADCIGYLVAAQAEHVDGCAGGQEVGLGTGFE